MNRSARVDAPVLLHKFRAVQIDISGLQIWALEKQVDVTIDAEALSAFPDIIKFRLRLFGRETERQGHPPMPYAAPIGFQMIFAKQIVSCETMFMPPKPEDGTFNAGLPHLPSGLGEGTLEGGVILLVREQDDAARVVGARHDDVLQPFD